MNRKARSRWSAISFKFSVWSFPPKSDWSNRKTLPVVDERLERLEFVVPELPLGRGDDEPVRVVESDRDVSLEVLLGEVGRREHELSPASRVVFDLVRVEPKAQLERVGDLV